MMCGREAGKKKEEEEKKEGQEYLKGQKAHDRSPKLRPDCTVFLSNNKQQQLV
jgi:hypothetical protein